MASYHDRRRDLRAATTVLSQLSYWPYFVLPGTKFEVGRLHTHQRCTTDADGGHKRLNAGPYGTADRAPHPCAVAGDPLAMSVCGQKSWVDRLTVPANERLQARQLPPPLTSRHFAKPFG